MIFLGGLHRSGTSLLFRILRDHPDISGFYNTGVPEDEGQLLQTVYPPARTYGGPGRFGFNSHAFLDEKSPLVSETNARKLFAEWGPYWNLESRYLLEKSPPNLVRSRFLQALFPGASFVMLLRHPVAVTFATQKWSGTAVETLLEHWLLCHERYEADKDCIDRLHTLKYEELIMDPEQRLAQIYEFLNLDPVPHGQVVEQGVNDKYFQRWRDTMSDSSARTNRIISRYEARVRAFGYSLEELDRVDCTL